ncbi:hypothetical protein GCM10010116_50250 [Microbispora rosea subsp. aerata]|nr:hypothetical protein GCM10010116_50250 [Microbispora rosea subsp. aerata]GIH57965.1 hypothetical protein Mro02_48790 [Microbispora rosea subsp. aerata]GLJ81462.1 hypothetical protein GCM10017588_01860 [Microbispora rosea subsp. aerata]
MRAAVPGRTSTGTSATGPASRSSSVHVPLMAALVVTRVCLLPNPGAYGQIDPRTRLRTRKGPEWCTSKGRVPGLLRDVGFALS